jgi:hypothetical protein
VQSEDPVLVFFILHVISWSTAFNELFHPKLVSNFGLGNIAIAEKGRNCLTFTMRSFFKASNALNCTAASFRVVLLGGATLEPTDRLNYPMVYACSAGQHREVTQFSGDDDVPLGPPRSTVFNTKNSLQ